MGRHASSIGRRVSLLVFVLLCAQRVRAPCAGWCQPRANRHNCANWHCSSCADCLRPPPPPIAPPPAPTPPPGTHAASHHGHPAELKLIFFIFHAQGILQVGLVNAVTMAVRAQRLLHNNFNTSRRRHFLAAQNLGGDGELRTPMASREAIQAGSSSLITSAGRAGTVRQTIRGPVPGEL